MLGGIGMPELIVILVIILLIFGAGRIPEIAKSLGKGIREFKKAGKEIDTEESKEESKEKTKEQKKG
ncbi:MAG: twin-arginine translocase TatA/TatE family subunit [bacterium]